MSQATQEHASATGQESGARMQALVERVLHRNIKGLQYFASPAPAVGSTLKDVLLKRGTMQLYRYRPLVDEVYRTPVLLVAATTNRGYIFDLAPSQSFVEFLLNRGYDVYMLDWSPPRPDERRLGLEDYVLGFIPDCAARIAAETGEPDITIAGYCMGGVLSIMYAALHPDGPLRNLACFTTPVDFAKLELFKTWSDRRWFDVDRLVDTLGNVPPEMIYAGFGMLQPATRPAGQVRLWDNLWSDEFVASYRMFDRWAHEILPLPGEYFRQTIKELLWENRLVEGGLFIGGREVDLSAIKVPVIHVVAEHDHIVPMASSHPLVESVGSADKQEVVLKGGHVSIVAGANAVKRLWPRLDSWLQERST